MISGGCLCGLVRYAIRARVEQVQLCHCRACQKAQGAPFASNVPVAAADFTFVSGADRLQDYESSPGKHRLFCGRCGSPVISRRDDKPDAVRVRAGTLDDAPGLRVVSHAHVADKASWWSIDDDLPAFDGPRPAAESPGS